MPENGDTRPGDCHRLRGLRPSNFYNSISFPSLCPSQCRIVPVSKLPCVLSNLVLTSQAVEFPSSSLNMIPNLLELTARKRFLLFSLYFPSLTSRPFHFIMPLSCNFKKFLPLLDFCLHSLNIYRCLSYVVSRERRRVQIPRRCVP